MVKLTICMTVMITVGNLISSIAQEIQTVYPEDFKDLIGNWQGSLTYVDYSSGKPYTMPADLKVTRFENTGEFIFANIYPNEPNANSSDTLIISPGTKFIDNELIKSKKKLENGGIEIITEESGTDGNDNKPAIFKYTYTYDHSNFKKRKDVQFTGTTVWINRHEYTYNKRPVR